MQVPHYINRVTNASSPLYQAMNIGLFMNAERYKKIICSKVDY